MRRRPSRTISACLAGSFVALALASSLGAQPRTSPLTLSTEEGRVLEAQLTSGARVELAYELTISFVGASARIRQGVTGLSATARASDVEVFLSRAIWRDDESLGLEPTTHLTLRSVGPREAVLDARGLSLEVSGVRVPRDALALARARSPVAVSPPAAWASVQAAPRRVLSADATLRRSPGGAAVGVAHSAALDVALLEDDGVHARIAVEDAGVRVLAWVDSDALSAPPPRLLPPSGGGGMGEGRLGLSRCPARTTRTLATREGDTPLYARQTGSARITRLRRGVSVVVEEGTAARLAVVELPGVERVGRCSLPIAWVARDAIAPREDPIDE